jgi:hypothetical protein
MYTKSSPSSATIKSPSQRPSSRVIDAFIIQSPDEVALALRLQNLVTFFLDIINTLATDESNQQSKIEQITSCLNHIETLSKNDENSFSKEMTGVIDELLEEGRKLEKILHTFKLDPSLSQTPLETLIAGKSTQLQWFGVCILEEIKKAFFKI